MKLNYTLQMTIIYLDPTDNSLLRHNDIPHFKKSSQVVGYDFAAVISKLLTIIEFLWRPRKRVNCTYYLSRQQYNNTKVGAWVFVRGELHNKSPQRKTSH